jgi:N-acetylglucosamine-6-phosphate deacetylase
MSQQQFSAAKIFTGNDWLANQIITVEAGAITNIENYSGVTDAAMIVPAFIDLQLYGAFGSLLAVEPTVETVEKIYHYSKQGGAAFCMPTVATNTTATIISCADAIHHYWAGGGKGVLGLHVEGPWINPIKRGAHVEALIHAPSLEEVTLLLDACKGTIKIITLAPEICSPDIIQHINSYGIVVFAGHSNASYEQAMQAFDNGIAAVTHLYNAMSPLQHRAPGVVGAAFNHPSVMASIITDGYHVDFAAISIAKKQMGERLFIITDAVTETESGYYLHQLVGDKYEANGTLSGSALTMIKAVQHLIQHTNITLTEALKMASLYPANIMNLDNKYGQITIGLPACFTVLDEQLNVLKVVD